MTKSQMLGVLVSLVCWSAQAAEITAHKFDEHEECLQSRYEIPSSSRFTTLRRQADAPELVYYMSKPHDVESFPIVIVCDGSTSSGRVCSVIHVHRYFLDEFLELGAAVVTAEQWGVDGNHVDEKLFMEHYTRTQRLHDHQDLINHLVACPPAGWNGRLILFGVSEGGPLVNSLTQEYAHLLDATVNWVGAGEQNWKEELWDFIKDFRKNLSWKEKLLDMLPLWFFGVGAPKRYDQYNTLMQQIVNNPTSKKRFVDMTYKYHADALRYPEVDYTCLKTPFLSVVGSLDPMIASADLFAQKAFAAGVPLTYMRIEGMNHRVRKYPEVIAQTFEWLKEQLVTKKSLQENK